MFSKEKVILTYKSFQTRVTCGLGMKNYMIDLELLLIHWYNYIFLELEFDCEDLKIQELIRSAMTKLINNYYFTRSC